MKNVVDILAIVSFVVGFVPLFLAGLLIIVGLLAGSKVTVSLKWQFLLYVAMVVWPIAYWLQ